MKILGPATRDGLILVWLRSEWDRVPPPRPPDRRLVDDADLADWAQNATRAELLYRDRGKILGELPAEISPVWVDIEKADLADLSIVPTFDWYLDTGRTFSLVDTPANLAHGRGFLSAQGPQPMDHLAKVEAIEPQLADYSNATTDEVLIMIAADQAGPYTIIDGTHRAAALYRGQLSEPNMPWRGILVADPAIARCVWHIESPKAVANMELVRQAVARRLIW